MTHKIQVRRGLQSDLPLLDEGEIGFSLDEKRTYIGSPSGNVELANKSEVTSITSQLAETETQISNTAKRRDLVRYGILNLPPDFPHKLPFDIWRDRDGLVKHTHKFENFKNDPTAGHVFVNPIFATDVNDGLTRETPVKSFPRALEVANSMAQETVVLHFLTSVFAYITFNNIWTYTLQKNIVMIPDNDTGYVVFTSGRATNAYTFTNDAGVYKTNRSAVTEVYDTKFEGYLGAPARYKKTATLAETQSTRGTWYTDGVAVWINRMDGSAPDNDLIIQLPLGFNLTLNIHGKRLVMDTNQFLFETTSGSALTVAGNAGSELWIKDSTFCHSKARNGLETVKIGKVFVFDSEAYENFADGFNYHGTLVVNPYEFVFEYNCHAWKMGNGTKGNCNASTAHEGMSVVRVATVGFDTWGPVIADVNGCYSVLIDCVAYDSNLVSGATNAAFYFDGNTAVKTGKAYLINCSGGGKSGTYAVNHDGTTDLYIQNLVGSNIPANLALTFAE